MIEGVSEDWRQVTSTLSVHTFSVHTHTIWHVTFTSTRQPGLQTSLVSWRNGFFLPRVSWALTARAQRSVPLIWFNWCAAEAMRSQTPRFLKTCSSSPMAVVHPDSPSFPPSMLLFDWA